MYESHDVVLLMLFLFMKGISTLITYNINDFYVSLLLFINNNYGKIMKISDKLGQQLHRMNNS